MPWVKIAAVPGFGVEAQDLLRWRNVPVASVKQRHTHYSCALLCVTGVSTVPLELPITCTVQHVREVVEATLREMGWTPEKEVVNE